MRNTKWKKLSGCWRAAVAQTIGLSGTAAKQLCVTTGDSEAFQVAGRSRTSPGYHEFGCKPSHGVRKPNAHTTGLLLLACLAVSGCNQAASEAANQAATAPSSGATNASAPSDISDETQQDETQQDETQQDETQQYGSYSYGMLPSDIPDDFQAELDEFARETRDVQQEFTRVLAELRQANDWLDRSLDDPIDAPILTEDGELPGPSTQEIHNALQPMFHAFAADYQQNSRNPDDEKKLTIEQFQTVIMAAYRGDEPDYKTLTAISDRFEAGDVDPITMLPLLEYESLRDNLRRQCMRRMGESLELRPCSSVTKLLMVSAAAEKSNYLSFADRILCTTAAIESVEDVLRDYKSVGAPLDFVVHNAGDALNPAGNIAYVKKVLSLEPEIAPDHLRHFLIAKIHGKVAGRARGGDFIGSVSEKNLQIFSTSSHHEAAHLLKSWTLAPTHSASTKTLLANELRSTSTPISAHQWYRIALTTQSDSRATTKLMAQSLQPRWGGSMQELAAYTKRIIELAQKPDTRMLWDVPLELYLWDATWCMNLARETDFDESILALLDAIEKTNGNAPDPRFTRQYAKLVARFLWDAGELDRLDQFAKRYADVIDGENWYSYLIPAHLVTQVMMARQELPTPAWDVLQRELMVGAETFDDERISRIDDAMKTVRGLVAEQEADGEKNKSAPDVQEDDTSDKGSEPGDQTEQTWGAMALVRFEQLDQTMRKFRDGKTVDLIGSEMGCWSCTSGGITFNDDSIDVQTNCRSKNLLFFQPLRFELPIVVELDVTQQECDADPYGIALFAGPIAENSTASRFSGRSLRYSPGYPMIMQDRLPSERLKGPNYHEQRLLPVPKWATLRIEVRPNGTRSFLNGELITETDERVNTGGYVLMGRRAGDTFTGVPNKTATYKLTSLRVQKLGPDLAYQPIKQVALETCRTWIAKNLDLGGRKLDDFQVSVYEYVYESGLQVLFVQFAHKRNMADIIHDRGIEIVRGGFPDYFSINVSTDGRRVLSHYAQSE